MGLTPFTKKLQQLHSIVAAFFFLIFRYVTMSNQHIFFSQRYFITNCVTNHFKGRWCNLFYFYSWGLFFMKREQNRQIGFVSTGFFRKAYSKRWYRELSASPSNSTPNDLCLHCAKNIANPHLFNAFKASLNKFIL